MIRKTRSSPDALGEQAFIDEYRAELNLAWPREEGAWRELGSKLKEAILDYLISQIPVPAVRRPISYMFRLLVVDLKIIC